MHIGVIGYRNHALKNINVLIKSKIVKKIIVYLYKKKINSNLLKSKKVEYTYDIKDLNFCSGVLICSPTSTHKYYISYFVKKKIFIFCEKPGSANKLEINYLKSLNKSIKKKIYFNYNLRFSKLHEQLEKFLKNKKFGKPILIDIKLSSGISFKKKFLNNWRFKTNNNFEKISGNLGVHYFNLLLKFFSLVKEKKNYQLFY